MENSKLEFELVDIYKNILRVYELGIVTINPKAKKEIPYSECISFEYINDRTSLPRIEIELNKPSDILKRKNPIIDFYFNETPKEINDIVTFVHNKMAINEDTDTIKTTSLTALGQYRREYKERSALEQIQECELAEKREAFIQDEQEYRNKKIGLLSNEGRKTYFEYKVIKQADKFSGATDIIKLQTTLNVLALEGWRVIAINTNELGKNALGGVVGGSVGIGLNSTSDETVVILERECFI